MFDMFLESHCTSQLYLAICNLHCGYSPRMMLCFSQFLKYHLRQENTDTFLRCLFLVSVTVILSLTTFPFVEICVSLQTITFAFLKPWMVKCIGKETFWKLKCPNVCNTQCYLSARVFTFVLAPDLLFVCLPAPTCSQS